MDKAIRSQKAINGKSTGRAHPSRKSGAGGRVARTGQPSFGPFKQVSFEGMAHVACDAIGDAVLMVDPNAKVIYLNAVAERLTGWPSRQALGRRLDEVMPVIDGTTRVRATNFGLTAIHERRRVSLTLGHVLLCRDGSDLAIEDSAVPVYSRSGAVASAVIVFHDARYSLDAIEAMSRQSQHDPLTGLPNRMLLKERLTQAAGLATRHGHRLAVMFLDLDEFKSINDRFGHAVGDQVLCDVGSEVSDCLRTTDTVSRHGGDEFVVLLSEINARSDAVHIAQKILAQVAVPRVVQGHDLQVTISLGISVFPEDGRDPDALIDSADRAMYTCKLAGRTRAR